MTDYFSLLGEPRRPWLDPEKLKEKFLALSSATHPDRQHSATATEKELAVGRFAALNAAYNCLRETRDRLRHLIELELGRTPKDLQDIPSQLADLFMDIASASRQTDALLREKSKTNSPLLQVQFFERAQAHVEKLTMLQKKIGELQTQTVNRVRELDAEWDSAANRHALLVELETASRLLGFCGRWQSQLREGIVQLTL